MCWLLSAREEFMSQHRSLKGASTIAAKRNVLKRFERVELLKKRGQWKEGRKVRRVTKRESLERCIVESVGRITI